MGETSSVCTFVCTTLDRHLLDAAIVNVTRLLALTDDPTMSVELGRERTALRTELEVMCQDGDVVRPAPAKGNLGSVLTRVHGESRLNAEKRGERLRIIHEDRLARSEAGATSPRPDWVAREVDREPAH